MNATRQPATYLALAVILTVPALVKMVNLIDAGRLTWVEGLTLFAGGMAGGALLARAVRLWRDRRRG